MGTILGIFLIHGYDPWDFFGSLDGYDPWDFFGDPWDFLDFLDLGFDPWDFFGSWVRPLGFLGLMIYFQFGHDVFST